MKKSEEDKWCDRRSAMFNAWERKNKFYCEMSGKKEIRHKGSNFECNEQCNECSLLVSRENMSS